MTATKPEVIRVRDGATRAEIEAAMVVLTERAKRACIPSTLREIRVAQDELVGLWLAAG